MHQMKDLAKEGHKTVHAINKSVRKWQKPNSTGDIKQRQGKEMESTGRCSCCRCKHVGKQPCPAKGKVCFKCNKLNHYSQMCKSKTVHEAPDDLDCKDGDFFIGIVNEGSERKDEMPINFLIKAI